MGRKHPTRRWAISGASKNSWSEGRDSPGWSAPTKFTSRLESASGLGTRSVGAKDTKCRSGSSNRNQSTVRPGGDWQGATNLQRHELRVQSVGYDERDNVTILGSSRADENAHGGVTERAGNADHSPFRAWIHGASPS